MQPTPTQAVVRGHLTVSVPSVVTLVVVAIVVHRTIGWNWYLSILAGSLAAWPVWAFMVPRWRDWVEDSGLRGEDVQALAANTLLVWPPGVPIKLVEFKRRNGTVGWTPQAGGTAPTADAPRGAEADLRAFIGPNAEYYVSRFSRVGMDGRAQWPGFNWAALIFGWAWLLYRRMYGTFWATVGIMIVLSMGMGVAIALSGRQEPPPGLSQAPGLLLMVLLGMFGNRLYYRHAMRKLERVSEFSTNREEELARAGGVSWIGPVVLCLVGLALILAAGKAGMAAG